MRTAIAVLVLAALASTVNAQPTPGQALDLIDELGLDDATRAKLVPVMAAYDRERSAQEWALAELGTLLRVAAHPEQVDRLLDRQLEAQKALLAAETAVVTKLRAILPAPQAARARVLLVGPAPRVESRPRTSYRRGDLFPPGSQFASREPCDPFAEMHGC